MLSRSMALTTLLRSLSPSRPLLCSYLGFKRIVPLDCKRLVVLLDLHPNGTLSQNNFEVAVHRAHEKKMAQPSHRRVIVNKPKEEDYFYANLLECLCEQPNCDDLQGPGERNSSEVSS